MLPISLYDIQTYKKYSMDKHYTFERNLFKSTSVEFENSAEVRFNLNSRSPPLTYLQ